MPERPIHTDKQFPNWKRMKWCSELPLNMKRPIHPSRLRTLPLVVDTERTVRAEGEGGVTAPVDLVAAMVGRGKLVPWTVYPPAGNKSIQDLPKTSMDNKTQN